MKILRNAAMLFLLTLATTSTFTRPAKADTAQMTIAGTSLLSYTVQFIQNGVVRWQSTTITIPAGKRLISVSGLPAGSGYIANAWANGVGEQSHTWPAKTLSGTTHLGCLAFDISGSPTPWSGSCP